ncbi:NADH-quinone oxidoreductase subunit M [Myxococcota bacterium]|nr:NADH-quinone oxidoreductase subunit M [Myxococcota bacterium]
MSGSAALLTAIVFLPAAGALVLALFPAEDRNNLKATALGITLLNFLLSLFLWTGFETGAPGYQFGAKVPWVPAFGISYNIGIDGISLFLILLTTFIMPITILGAWTAVETRVREWVIAMCVLETGMLGAFVSLDLFLFYVFWEAMLIPMYFLIGIWGGQRRIYAAVKFFIFTFAGSVFMLIAILVVASQPDGSWSFELDQALRRTFAPETERLLFIAFAVAFAIKVPMFPLHTWLPDAHVEAPTSGSVILAGVLLKLGVYGFIRFAFPMFPNAAMEMLPIIGWLAVISIIYGALVAWVQPDMKKLVAYSSVSHLGFCMLGLAAMTVEGVTGAVYQMLAHGISTGGLFLLVGVLYERRHTRILADYGGIAKKVPVFAFFLVFVVMASAGLPALSGFPGEFMILLGTFTAGPGPRLWAILSATGVILAAIYLLWMVQKVLFGPLNNPANESLTDMNGREIAVMIPMAVMAIVLGVAPFLFVKDIEPAVQRFVLQVHQRSGSGPYQADAGALRQASATPVLGTGQGPNLRARPQFQPNMFRPMRFLDRAGQPLPGAAQPAPGAEQAAPAQAAGAEGGR